ncbi:MAG: SpoIIE family protein phosphatase [Phycisphaeraceae bacterium]|nr:MAG: SpoIIE family protein phosphatase [Phycisphaeraceae bacterium]
MSNTQSVKSIQFSPLAGPAMEPPVITSASPVVIGRSGQADVRLLDDTVSRRHAQVSLRADTWTITDLESRHGTSLNGVVLPPNEPAPIREGDLVAIGPWTFMVRAGGSRQGTSFLTTSDDVASGPRVERVPEAELSIRAQARLDLLTESAATISAARTEPALAEAVLGSAVAGTGFGRAAFLRQVGGADEVELVAFRTPTRGGMSLGGGPPEVSRSLIRAASEGQIVRMEADSPVNFGQSIVQLGIHSALCAPVIVGERPAGFIYLDARNSESQVHQDAAAFCQALARIAGMALANLRSAEIDRRRQELERDIEDAHEAQQRLMPPTRGALGRIRYAMRSIPGRLVAGDLFDIFRLDERRVGVFLGDVSGKGVGAAMLMATAQAHLNVSLRQYGDPAAALTAANRYISQHCEDGKFISLWIGVIEPREDGSAGLRFVDAGHGHWLSRPGGGTPVSVSSRGGIPIGVEDGFEYEAEELVLPPGSRLVVYSDGVVEQQAPSGDQFGLERAVAALNAVTSAEHDVEALVQAVAEFAFPPPISGVSPRPVLERSSHLADDVTVASIELA